MGATRATVFPETLAPAPGAERGSEAADARRLLPVTVADGRVVTGDRAILAGLGAHVAQSTHGRSDVGVVLRVRTASGTPASSEDAAVGSLCCKRCGARSAVCERSLNRPRLGDNTRTPLGAGSWQAPG